MVDIKKTQLAEKDRIYSEEKAHGDLFCTKQEGNTESTCPIESCVEVKGKIFQVTFRNNDKSILGYKIFARDSKEETHGCKDHSYLFEDLNKNHTKKCPYLKTSLEIYQDKMRAIIINIEAK